VNHPQEVELDELRSSAPIDPDVIEGLRELGGDDEPELLAELIEIFLRDAPQRIGEIERGLRTSDIALLERASHTLKSSSANIGALGLSELCRRIERSAREGSLRGLDTLVEVSSEVYGRVDGALREISRDAGA
jgi:HPt (histidine-containing phosphotransfer) domain-containing protein